MDVRGKAHGQRKEKSPFSKADLPSKRLRVTFKERVLHLGFNVAAITGVTRAFSSIY